MAESNASKFSSKITSDGTIGQGGLAAGVAGVGGTDWQAVKTTSFTAVAGEGYFVNTTSGAITITLPGSPSVGDTIEIRDYSNSFGTNNVTLNPNGKKINGSTGNGTLDTNDIMVVIVYSGEDKGWLSVENEAKTNLVVENYITATGGTVTTSGDYKIHTFTGDGCFVVSSIGSGIPCAQASTVDYLVVAGGAGGGGNDGGGGAGGGYRESKDSTLSSPHTASPLAATTGLTVSATTYPITVGSGGSAGTSTVNGGSGSNSVFSTIISAGAGGGKSESGTPNNGVPGGSGGGASASGGSTGVGGTGNNPPVSPPQGNNGGSSYNPAGAGGTPGCRSGGGGGGAGSVGGNANGGGGDGGSGTTSSINGTPTERSSGAGGGARGPAGPGGNPGGAGAGAGTTNGTAGSGSANSGGGGGGKGENPPIDVGIGSGGSGVVIIRYKFQ